MIAARRAASDSADIMNAPIPTGVLGLGLIGSIWARHLHDDGWLAGAWNRTPQPDFPRWKDSPAAVADAADALLLVVSDPPAVASVLDALQDRLQARHVVIQCSTIDPASSARFEQQVRARGARYVEAPFSGSKPGAETRRTVYYLGGDADAIGRAQPVLERLSQQRHLVGTGAQAALLKLASNLQIVSQLELLCETLRWARAAGVPDDTFFAMLRGNMAWSGVYQIKEPKLRHGDYAPQFAVRHMLKDVRLALGAAPTDLPVGAAVAERLQAAADRGLGGEDISVLYRLLEP